MLHVTCFLVFLFIKQKEKNMGSLKDWMQFAMLKYDLDRKN